MYCFKCPNKKLSPPSEAILLPKPVETAKNTCKGCGYDLGNNLKLSKVFRCKNCNDYMICSNCKLCKKGHQMFKCYNLKPKGASLYLSNKYGCDFCNATNAIDHQDPLNNFVWHCNPCKYDVCPSHFFETTLQIEQEEIRKKEVKEKGIISGKGYVNQEQNLSGSKISSGTIIQPSPYDHDMSIESDHSDIQDIDNLD